MRLRNHLRAAALTATEGPVEQLTFLWEAHGPDMGHLVVEWETTGVEIPVQKGGM